MKNTTKIFKKMKKRNKNLKTKNKMELKFITK